MTDGSFQSLLMFEVDLMKFKGVDKLEPKGNMMACLIKVKSEQDFQDIQDVLRADSGAGGCDDGWN